LALSIISEWLCSSFFIEFISIFISSEALFLPFYQKLPFYHNGNKREVYHKPLELFCIFVVVTNFCNFFKIWSKEVFVLSNSNLRIIVSASQSAIEAPASFEAFSILSLHCSQAPFTLASV
jgi:hypothetical protein